MITQADRTLVVSEPMRASLLERIPGLPPQDVITLTNGFDPADFAGQQPVDNRNERFTITYTGSFYARAISPTNFLSRAAPLPGGWIHPTPEGLRQPGWQHLLCHPG